MCMVKSAELIVGFSPSFFLQDEQLYRNLHEEINSLALKLEKQGKTDGKNISTRRKHINKMYVFFPYVKLNYQFVPTDEVSSGFYLVFLLVSLKVVEGPVSPEKLP